jgi:bifunctional non-homologous end joining protein LigD
MLATAIESPSEADLRNPALLYEPKLDGIRGLILLEPAQPTARVTIWSRLGNNKTNQFPEVVKGLKDFGRRLRKPVLLDGEIVALDKDGEPAGFQRLQGRMHLMGERDIAREAAAQRAAFIAFDVLRDGVEDLRPLPLTDRRARLERIFGTSGSDTVRFGEYVAGDGRRLYQQALARGWEGLIVKVADSSYETGRRSKAWRKLKIVKQQEFVVGGWTEPRETRAYFGALLLGVFEEGTNTLRYVGHSGTGFTHQELGRVFALLQARATTTSPFASRVPTNERPHWVRPELVCQVRFTDWTDEHYLRHPVYLGLRDDVDPKTIRVEPGGVPIPLKARGSSVESTSPSSDDDGARAPAAAAVASSSTRTSKRVASKSSSPPKTKASSKSSSSSKSGGSGRIAATAAEERDLLNVVEQLQVLEDTRRDGTITLPDGLTLDVTNPAKVFWPAEKLTKGDLLRFYVRVSPWLLPAVEDRPLVMKRFPNGINNKAFYQQRAPDDVPPGVRVEMTEEEGEPDGMMPRLVGGSLVTLLYQAQLAAISQDPWFSRVQTPQYADYVALDLDPMPGVSFAQVLEVARYVHEEIDALDIPAVPKTSGSSGLHVYIPLPPRTTYESGLLLCHIVATMVAMKHGRIATVERAVAKRGKKVYVDYLQNIEGKTLATVYSARASEFAGVSTPLTWDEVYEGVEPHDFTLRTALARFEKVGDLWAPVRHAKPVDLRDLLGRLASQG